MNNLLEIKLGTPVIPENWDFEVADREFDSVKSRTILQVHKKGKSPYMLPRREER